MRNDLLFAVFVAIVINLAIWIVGAEILQPNGIEVKTLGDPGKALELFFGPIGWYVFFIGVFATLFASGFGGGGCGSGFGRKNGGFGHGVKNLLW